MKKILLILLLLLTCLVSNAQFKKPSILKADTVSSKISIPVINKLDTIITAIGTFYYDRSIKGLIMVTYDLDSLKSGDCSRYGMTFKSYPEENPYTAIKSDYAYNGYDIGHMIPAEHFAWNCTLEKLTFFYYNAVPQTAHLNRGIWKQYETITTKIKGPIRTIIFNKFGTKTIGNGVHVPVYQYRIIQNKYTKEILYCLKFIECSDIAESVTIYQIKKDFPNFNLPLIK